MNLITQALQQFVAEAHLFQQQAHRTPRDASRECGPLASVLERFSESNRSFRPNRPSLNSKKVWSDFQACGFDLKQMDRLEVRTLCSSEDTALQPELIDALQADSSVLLNDRCLHGFVTRYFAEWRTMAQPETVEALLRSVFAQYTGKNPAALGWAKAGSLFSAEAASFLANEICTNRLPIEDVVKAHYIEPVTNLANATFASAAAEACQTFRKEEKHRGEEWRLQYLRWMTEQILRRAGQESLAKSVSWLILSESARESVTFQQSLRDYVQRHDKLGDPRWQANMGNWRQVDPAAAKLYLSWLARDYIIYFFETILPKSSENRRRKEFWLRYHDRVKDFQVAVSQKDEWKLKANQTFTRVYSQSDDLTVSAFLMRFESYRGPVIIAEFSETGNAAYILKLVDFTSRKLDIRQPRFSLKALRFDKSNRILHIGEWELKAAQALSAEFGIQP